jgi:ankyrin repeat protein
LPINGKNNAGETPLLINFGQPRYDDFMDFMVGFTTKVKAGHEDDDDIMALFKKAGADFQARNNAGQSLLHLVAAATTGSTRVRRNRIAKLTTNRFQALLDMGLDPMLEDNQQRTSLDIAAACRNEDILKLFERKAA